MSRLKTLQQLLLQVALMRTLNLVLTPSMDQRGYPPHGRVRVAVPLRVNDEAVRLAVVTKLGWIKRQQARFEAQPRQPQREMVSGETHYFQGTGYRLEVIKQDGPARVTLRGKTTLTLTVPASTTSDEREEVLIKWYRKEIKLLIPPLVAKWEPVIEVQATAWGVKRMRTKWGSCNTRARRIWLNLELIKKPAHCLEYVVVHELVHLLEPHHDKPFTTLMDEHLPQWRMIQQELNAKPLAHEDWA